jgi:hypothetical protein
MANCYDRAMAFALLDIVSLDNHYQFQIRSNSGSKGGASSTIGGSQVIEYYSASEPKVAQRTELQIFNENVQYQSTAGSEDNDNMEELDMLLDVISKTESVDHIVDLFKEFDEDGSGGLDCEELQSLLEMLNIDIEIDKVKGLISAIDIEGKGTIDLDESINFITHIRHNASARIDAIKMRKRFCVSAGPKERLIPWKEGKIVMALGYQFGCPVDYSAFSLTQVMQVLSAAEMSSNAQIMIKNALEGARLHLPEAQYMLDGLSQISDNVVEALEYLLPGMMTIIEAQQLLKIGIKTEFKLLRELKRNLGSTLNLLLGYYTGYYRLDLLKEKDSKCFFMLLQRSASLSHIRREYRSRYDISQNGNWSCFRNTNWFAKPSPRKLNELISIETFYPLPSRGIIEFDFCDWDKPNIHLDRPINDSKVISLLTVCRFIKTEKSLKRASDRLSELKMATKMMIKESGYRYWKVDAARAVAVAEYLHEMYTSRSRGFEKRYSSLRKAMKKEKIGEKKEKGKEEETEGDASDGEENESDGETEAETEGGGEEENEGDGDGGDNMGDGTELLMEDANNSLDIASADVGDDNGSTGAGGESKPSTASSAHDGGLDSKQPKLASVMSLAMAGMTKIKEKEKDKTALAAASSESSRGSGPPTVSAGVKKAANNLMKSKEKDNSDNDGSHAPVMKLGAAMAEMVLTQPQSSSLRRQQREFDALLASKRASNENKCLIITEYIESSLLGRRLYCRQLALIVEFFKIGKAQKSNMGTYRVELVINAFHRILDLNNFELVLMVLTAREHAAVIARLGWLAVFNPCKPEGYYELDLTRWEERHLFKMLIQLSFTEKVGCKQNLAYFAVQVCFKFVINILCCSY